MSRYQGKPLLRLLECYVLSAIGELPDADEHNLANMTPKLQQAYGAQGNWREIIAQVMQFPANMDSELQRMWIHNQHLAAQNGEGLLAEDFARLVAEDNFIK